MPTIRPFAAPEFTPFKNDALDYIMPRVSGSAWKVLCVAIRKTWGWADDQSPTGRKQSDTISFSQFREATGIKSDTTIARAIQECINAGYLTRSPSRAHKQQFDYALNTSFKLEVEPTSTEIEEVTSTETVEVTNPTSTVSVDTKETSFKERGNKKLLPTEEAGASAPAAGAEDEKDQVHPVNTSPKRTRRPRVKSQAVKLFHTTFKLWPTTKQQEIIDGQVKDLGRWREVLQAWAGQGHKPLNVTGQLDWYRDGIPDHARRGGKRKRASKERRPDDYTAGEYGDFVLA